MRDCIKILELGLKWHLDSGCLYLRKLTPVSDSFCCVSSLFWLDLSHVHMFSLVWFAANIQTVDLIQCFLVIFALSNIISWSCRPCSAKYPYASSWCFLSHSCSCIHSCTQTVVNSLGRLSAAPRGQLLTHLSFHSGLLTASSMPKNTKKCINNTDSRWRARVGVVIIAITLRTKTINVF